MQIIAVTVLVIMAYLLFTSKVQNKLLKRLSYVAGIIAAVAAVMTLVLNPSSGGRPQVEQATATSDLSPASVIADTPTSPPTQRSPSVLSETTVPTATLSPTETPTQPVVLPTEPNPFPLPFSDNFDNELSSEWQVLSGTPIISNGALESAGDDLTIQTGYIDTEVYSMSFDFYCNFSLDAVFAETVKMSFRWGMWRLQMFANNKWQTIEDVDGPNTCKMNTLQKVQINVSGSTYEFVFAGEKVYEGTFGKPSRGPITLTLDEYQRIDNVALSGN
jgi:hypothetical protein